MKNCAKCGVEKTEENSWKRTAYCKPCYNEWKKGNRLKNKEKIKIRRSNEWFNKHSRKCIQCNGLFVGKGRKRKFCSTKCKLMGSIIKRKNSGCWEWYKCLGNAAYPQTTEYETGLKLATHRLSYKIFIGEVPSEKFVCHKCDNGLCINPDHLFLGTAQENMQDAKNKKRLIKGGRKKLTEEEVKGIKNYIKQGIKADHIAKIFNISIATVHDIKYRKTWKHIE